MKTKQIDIKQTLDSSVLGNSKSSIDFLSPRAPNGLLCELMEHPELSFIQSKRPCFGWIVNHPVSGDMQTAYQVLVATSEENIRNNTGDLWDSGKVVSGESINVQYNGRSLQSNAEYYWKVRTWNKQNKASPYSEPQAFRTGKLKPGYSTACYPLVKHEIAPVRVVKKKEGIFFDFGRASFGTLRIVFTRPLANRRVFEVHLGGNTQRS